MVFLILVHPAMPLPYGSFGRRSWIFGKELASNRPHRPASRYHRLDLYPLNVSTMCGPDDLALTSLLAGFNVDTLFSDSPTIMGDDNGRPKDRPKEPGQHYQAFDPSTL